MTETVSAREITITRVYDAPRELVWRAWTEPDRLATWWGKRGWTTPASTITMDVRPGGSFRLTSVSDANGNEMATEAVYREVVEPERLVFEEIPREDCHQGSVGIVTFTDLGDDRTEMHFQTTIQVTGDYSGAAEAGMASAFDRLAEHLG